MRLTKMRAAWAVACLILALGFAAPQFIQADEWNRATRFSVNHPFQVPGLVLQPNTNYVIKLFESPAERNVVQIFNEDQTELLATFFGITAQRPRATDDSEFTFMETEPGYPLPLQYWYYPGRLIGLEFVYPKDQATQITQHSGSTVLSMDSADLEDIDSIEVERMESTETAAVEVPADLNLEIQDETDVQVHEQVAQLEEQKPLESPSFEEQRPLERPAIEEQTVEESSLDEQPDELPRTGGELPLLGLVGLLSLGGALGLRVLSAKS
jgi:hypothetical protein